MSSVSGAGNQPIKPMDTSAANAEAKVKQADEAKVGVKSGNINTAGTVSVALNTAPTTSGMSDTSMLAAPNGNTAFLGTITPNEMESVISGLNAESEELKTQSKADEIQDTIKSQEKSVNDLLEAQAAEKAAAAESSGGCDAVMAVIGAIIPVVGIALIASEITSSATESGAGGGGATGQINELQAEYYGEEGAQSINTFLDHYDEATTVSTGPWGKPMDDEMIEDRKEGLDMLLKVGMIDQGGYDEEMAALDGLISNEGKASLQTELDTMLSGGVITKEQHDSLSSTMVSEPPPPLMDLERIFLTPAVGPDADGNFPAVSGDGPMSNSEFGKWFSTSAREMEKSSEALAEVQEQMEAAKSNVIGASADQQLMMTMGGGQMAV
ncbi:MAG: hypothetical protein KAG53_00755 [Endozoicomonadaceae bacterium]|nr:hypothetical protein [Endozoicomonadaceae bacterium]